MTEIPNGHIKHVDIIPKAGFIRMFSEDESPGRWFTEGELTAFAFPRNAGSLKSV